MSERLPMPVRLSMWSPGASRLSEPITRMLIGPEGPVGTSGVGLVLERVADVEDVEVGVVVPVEEHHAQPGHQGDHDHGRGDDLADRVVDLDLALALAAGRGVAGRPGVGWHSRHRSDLGDRNQAGRGATGLPRTYGA